MYNIFLKSTTGTGYIQVMLFAGQNNITMSIFASFFFLGGGVLFPLGRFWKKKN